jgi:hypothetical protein
MTWCATSNPVFEQQSALNRAVIRASLGGNITQHLAGALFALKAAQERSSLILPRYTQLSICIPKIGSIICFIRRLDR